MAKLLLIDDDRDVQDYLTTALTQRRHEVVAALDGPSGLARARDSSIQILLVDLHLPGPPTGLDLVRQLRALRPECPVIVISGYPTAERMNELESMGISDFLTKPFEVGFISKTISRLLGTA